MGLTQTGTDGIKDDAITLAKQAAGTDGQIITYDASGNPVAIGPGTDGQVLTSTGAGSPPAFEAIPTPVDATKTTLTGSTNNTICTVTGANAISGEANLTFDGNQLSVTTNSSPDPLVVNSTYANKKVVITETSDANSNGGIVIQKKHSTLQPANYWYGDIAFHGWDGSQYLRGGLIECRAEGTPASNNMPGYMAFSTNGGAASHTERLRITSGGDVEVKTGNLVIGTAGKGIDFSAQTASSATGASATGELLDHYEEGTWTPVLTSGFTYQTLSASYTRIGNVVNVYFNMYRNDSGTYSGEIEITGLPFAIASTSAPFTNSMGLGLAASYNGSSDRRIGFINTNNASSVKVIKAGTTSYVSYDDFTPNTRAFTMKWWYYTA